MTTNALRFIAGLAVLVALDFAGGWLARVSHVPIPGSVLGMLILTALIELGVIPMRYVRDAAEFLVRHLALLYVPAGVSIIAYYSMVRGGITAIVAAALASLVAALLVVGIIVQRFERDA
ncbi:MAG: CidA/LrgA family protein [Gemmatimonadaceae bacterium]